jgi:hypothetical protein
MGDGRGPPTNNPTKGTIISPKSANNRKPPEMAAGKKREGQETESPKAQGRRQQDHVQELYEFMDRITDKNIAKKAKEAWNTQTLDDLN